MTAQRSGSNGTGAGAKYHARLGALLAFLPFALLFVWLPQAPPAQPSDRLAVPSAQADAIVPITETSSADAPKVVLGERLFHDVRFSRDNSLSCASCHALGNGGADGLARSVGFGGQQGERNAPSVFNVAFNFRQFWDGRAATLEAQIDGPIHNAKELNTSWPEIVDKLAGDSALVAQVKTIYPDGLQPANLKDALAAFERSLITPNSRFDRYLKGDRAAMTANELEGYRRFTEYGCISCHQGVNIGGNMFARLGAVNPYRAAQPADSSSLGRYNVTKRNEDRYVFRVPSLRNVALTAPYFHDGSVSTLEEAVTLMALHQLGVKIPDEDVSLIVRFLGSLTGEYRGKPL